MCKQVGSWLTVNKLISSKFTHRAKLFIQQSFGLSASLAWVGMVFAYKTDNWDEHEYRVHDNSLTIRSPSAICSWCHSTVPFSQPLSAHISPLVRHFYPITHSVPAEGAEAGCRRRHREDRCSSQVGRLFRKRLRYGPHNASVRTRVDVGLT